MRLIKPVQLAFSEHYNIVMLTYLLKNCKFNDVYELQHFIRTIGQRFHVKLARKNSSEKYKTKPEVIVDHVTYWSCAVVRS